MGPPRPGDGRASKPPWRRRRDTPGRLSCIDLTSSVVASTKRGGRGAGRAPTGRSPAITGPSELAIHSPRPSSKARPSPPTRAQAQNSCEPAEYQTALAPNHDTSICDQRPGLSTRLGGDERAKRARWWASNPSSPLPDNACVLRAGAASRVEPSRAGKSRRSARRPLARRGTALRRDRCVNPGSSR